MNVVEIGIDVLEQAAEKGFAHLAEAAIESAGEAAQSWGKANDKIEASSESSAKDSAAAYDKAGKDISDSADKAQRESGKSLEKIGDRADQTASKASLLTGAFGALSGGAEALGLGPLATGLQTVGIAADTASGFADITAVSFEGLKNKFKGVSTAATETASAQVAASAQAVGANTAEAASAQATADVVVAAEGEKQAASANTADLAGKNGGKWANAGKGFAIAAVGATALGVAGYALQPILADALDGANAWIESMPKLREQAGQLASAIRQDGEAFGALTRQQIVAQVQNNGIAASLKGTGASLADVTAALTASDSQFDKAYDTWVATGKVSDNAKVNLLAYRGALMQTRDANLDQDQANKQLNNSTEDLTDSTSEMGKTFQQAATQMRPVDDILRTLNGDTLDNVTSQLRLRDSLSGLKDDLDEHSKSLDENTTAGRKNKEAILDRIQSMNQQFSSTYQATGSIQQASAELSKNETALRNAAKAAGLNSTEVDNLIKKYGAVPKKVSTQLILDAHKAFETADTFMGKIDALKQMLSAGDISGWLQYGSKVDIGSSGRGTAGRAAGGPGSGWTVVGEHGPERVKLPNGSTVMSNPDSMAMGGDGAAAPVRLVIESSGSAVDDFIVEIIRRSVRTRGGDVQLVLGNGN